MTQNIKKTIKVGGFIVFFILICVYAFFRSSDLIFGVKLRDVQLSTAESSLTVTGNAKNATLLSLNGRPISIDQSGNFKESAVLLLGYNVINIKAVDKFGNIDEGVYQLIR